MRIALLAMGADTKRARAAYKRIAPILRGSRASLELDSALVILAVAMTRWEQAWADTRAELTIEREKHGWSEAWYRLIGNG